MGKDVVDERWGFGQQGGRNEAREGVKGKEEICVIVDAASEIRW